MSGGLFTNQLLRETAVEIDPERVERLQRAHARAYQQYSVQIPPSRRAQAARLAHRNTNSLGYRYQRPDGDGGGQSRNAQRRSPQALRQSRAIRSGTQSRIRICSWPQPTVSVSPSKGRLWSGTVFEICSRQRAAGRWGSDCSAADTVPMNYGRQAPSASTRIQPTSWTISTRSAEGDESGCIRRTDHRKHS